MSRETSRGQASVQLMCDTFGISRQAYYAARQRPAGPVRVSTPPARQGAWASAEELRAAIHELTNVHLAWGVRKIWAVLRRRGLRTSQKRVWAIMKADGLTLERPAQRESPGRYGHVAVPESNRRWGTDLTTVWTRRDGTVALVPVMDYGDRFVFGCEVTRSQESEAVLAPLHEALVAEFGAPENVPDSLELRSDHGPQFTGGDCDDLCHRWHVDHTFAPVGRPTGNAVVERFIETLKIELIWTRDWESTEELRQAIDEWLELYNHHRPHQALAWMTPAEKRAANLGLPLAAAA